MWLLTFRRRTETGWATKTELHKTFDAARDARQQLISQSISDRDFSSVAYLEEIPETKETAQ